MVSGAGQLMLETQTGARIPRPLTKKVSEASPSSGQRSNKVCP
jgi:hypothetical protein